MNTVSTRHLLSRQPLSALSKTSAAALLGMTILCGIMSFFSFALLITTATVLLSAILVAVGIRWAPLLGSLLNGSFTHMLATGRWQNSQPEGATEPGAPAIKHLQVSGGSVEAGPFNTAGTYHIYCTIHPGMTLTIIVQ